MENKLVDYLVVSKGYSQYKALKALEALNKLEAVDAIKANDYLEDLLRHTEMLTLLKEYILTENVKMPKIRITKAQFEEHFHIIEANGRGRKPKEFYQSTEQTEDADESAGDNVFNL